MKIMGLSLHVLFFSLVSPSFPISPSQPGTFLFAGCSPHATSFMKSYSQEHSYCHSSEHPEHTVHPLLALQRGARV